MLPCELKQKKRRWNLLCSVPFQKTNKSPFCLDSMQRSARGWQRMSSFYLTTFITIDHRLKNSSLQFQLKTIEDLCLLLAPSAIRTYNFRRRTQMDTNLNFFLFNAFSRTLSYVCCDNCGLNLMGEN